jgi:peptidoglycan/LPS O-acetylase OafA/YrhL
MTIYRQDIDGLRAIAVLSVLAFHAFPQALPGGFTGVDIFFVISGYLISTILIQDLASQKLSLSDFYARRIKRIFPALITILISCFFIGFFLFTPAEFKQLNQLILGGSTFSSNFILLKQSGYFDNAAETKPLMHLWSLAIEEQFYILWPILLIYAHKLRGRLGILIITIAILIISLYLNLSSIQHNPIYTFYHPKSRFWELLIGSLIASTAYFYHQKFWETHYRFIKNIIAVIGIALIVGGFFLIKPTNHFPGYLALIPTIGTALLIISGPNTFTSSKILTNKYLVFIGLISYPLYLWHWPLLSFARVFNNGAPSTEVLWGLIGVSFLLAIATYYLIERPIRYGLKNWRQKIMVLCLLMLGIAITSFLSKSFRGIPERFSIPALQINDGQFNCKNSIEEMCILGNTASQKTILMYGDSHVGYLTKALASESNDYKIIFFNEGICFFSNATMNTDRCRIMRQQLIELQKENIYAVIRNQRWHAVGVTDEKSIKDSINDAATASQLNPKKVIILSTTPDIDVPCHFANYYIPLRKQSCTEHLESINHVKKFIEVSQASNMPTNVYFVHPYQIICPNGSCTVIEGNVSNYFDGNHLSLDGAKKIIPHILKILESR